MTTNLSFDPTDDGSPRSLSRTLGRNSRGWERAWQTIATMYGDVACLNEGEVWQYMGSVSFDDGATWEHQFRHRALPSHGGRRYENVPAAADDFEEIPSPGTASAGAQGDETLPDDPAVGATASAWCVTRQ